MMSETRSYKQRGTDSLNSPPRGSVESPPKRGTDSWNSPPRRFVESPPKVAQTRKRTKISKDSRFQKFWTNFMSKDEDSTERLAAQQSAGVPKSTYFAPSTVLVSVGATGSVSSSNENSRAISLEAVPEQPVQSGIPLHEAKKGSSHAGSCAEETTDELTNSSIDSLEQNPNESNSESYSKDAGQSLYLPKQMDTLQDFDRKDLERNNNSLPITVKENLNTNYNSFSREGLQLKGIKLVDSQHIETNASSEVFKSFGARITSDMKDVNDPFPGTETLEDNKLNCPSEEGLLSKGIKPAAPVEHIEPNASREVCESFGAYIASKLYDMPEKQMKFFEEKILDIFKKDVNEPFPGKKTWKNDKFNFSSEEGLQSKGITPGDPTRYIEPRASKDLCKSFGVYISSKLFDMPKEEREFFEEKIWDMFKKGVNVHPSGAGTGENYLEVVKQREYFKEKQGTIEKQSKQGTSPTTQPTPAKKHRTSERNVDGSAFSGRSKIDQEVFSYVRKPISKNGNQIYPDLQNEDEQQNGYHTEDSDNNSSRSSYRESSVEPQGPSVKPTEEKNNEQTGLPRYNLRNRSLPKKNERLVINYIKEASGLPKAITTAQASLISSKCLLVVGLVLLAAVVIAAWFLYSPLVPTRYLLSTTVEKLDVSIIMDKLKKQFPQQPPMTFRIVENAIKDLVNPEPKAPAIIALLASAGAGGVTQKFANQLASSIASVKHSVRISGDEYQNESPDDAKYLIDKRISNILVEDKLGAVVIDRLDYVPSEAALILHTYCDHENAPYKRAIFLFTVQAEEKLPRDAPKEWDRILQQNLNGAWSATGEDQVSALLTRITVHVAAIFP